MVDLFKRFDIFPEGGYTQSFYLIRNFFMGFFVRIEQCFPLHLGRTLQFPFESGCTLLTPLCAR